jgi:hypothetical protein
MMAFPMRRVVLARSLVVLAALAVPLVGAGVAQAALAGANPLTTTNRPDLRTATLVTGSTNQVKFCFTQTISQISSQGAFSVGGYASAGGAPNFLTSTNPTVVDPTNNKCVIATFPVSIGDTGDLVTTTIAQVAEGAVLTTVGSGLVGNRADSTALTGSTTHNGTAGHTTAPDLTGIVVDNVNTGNTLDFIYDQNVQISTIDSTKFTAYYQDGIALTGAPPFGTGGFVSGIVAGGNVVKVTFSAASPLSTAAHGPTVIGVSQTGAVRAQTPNHDVSTTDASAVAGTAGATTRLPDLQAAQLSTDGSFIDYTFDKPIAGPCTPPSAQCVGGLLRLPAGAQGNYQTVEAGRFIDTAGSAFSATDCKGIASPAGGPCVAGGGKAQLPNNVVRAYFDNSPTLLPIGSPSVYETLVKAAVTPGAAQTTGLVGNGFGEAPIGGNQGAFATGFTEGPDAFKVTFDNATNTAAALFDARVFFTNAPQFVLLDANGTPLPGGTGVAAGPLASGGDNTGPYVITVSFTGASVANAKALEIKGPLLGPSAASTRFSGGVQQIVSPVGAAAVLKPGAKVHWVKVAVKKHHVIKKHRHHKH